MKVYTVLTLVFILSLAAFFRLYNLDKVYGFYGDQGQDLLAVNRWIEGGPIPLVGILTSIGSFHMPPLYYYLITPFVYVFGKSPMSPVYLFITLGLGLIALTFFLLNKFTDYTTAYIGSLLIALSPHAVFTSMGAYSPNLEIFFSVALLFSIIKFIDTGKYYYAFLIYFFIGIGLQMHYTLLSLLSIATIMIIIFKRQPLFKIKFWVAALLGFVIPLIPFIIGQFFLEFADLINIYTYLSEPSAPVKYIFPTSIIDRITFPFLIYFKTDYLPWALNILVVPFLLVIFLGSFFIAFTKNHLSYFTKIILVFFLLGIAHSFFGKLRFWWWYNDFYSIGALFLIAIVISYLYHYAKIQFLWIVLFGIFVIWGFINLPDVYTIGKSAEATKLISNTVSEDIKRSNIFNKDLGILAIQIVSGGGGFEYSYLLEAEGFKTFQAYTLDHADYLIIEKNSSSPANFDYDKKKLKFSLVKNLKINDHSTILKGAEIYRVQPSSTSEVE